MRLDWQWAFASEILPKLARALQVTVLATVCGMGLALLGGLFVAVLRRSRFRAISWTAGIFVEFIRSTPLLVQLYFLFYVMPGFGLKLSPLLTGVIGLGFHYSAYTSEVYRAGIDSVPKGQWEAGAALNFTPSQRFLKIILPQAIPPVVPALGNYLVAMFKDTPLLSTITVYELLFAAKDIGSETFRYLEPLTLVGLLFLAVSLTSAQLIRLIEKALRVRPNRVGA